MNVRDVAPEGIESQTNDTSACSECDRAVQCFSPAFFSFFLSFFFFFFWLFFLKKRLTQMATFFIGVAKAQECCPPAFIVRMPVFLGFLQTTRGTHIVSNKRMTDPSFPCFSSIFPFRLTRHRKEAALILITVLVQLSWCGEITEREHAA